MSTYKQIIRLVAQLSVLLCSLIPYTRAVTPWLEVKPSYFFFSASPMNDIYDDGGFELQGSASIPFCKHIDFYASIGYRKVSGRALNSCEKTDLTVIPVDIGIKPIVTFCERFYTFLALGPRYFHFHQHNTSPYVECNINGNGIGFFVNTGFNVLLADCLLLGIFGEYSYEKKKVCPNMTTVFSNGAVQLGGFVIGVSLGYAF